MYLTAIDAAKDRAIAMQGVAYGAGAVVPPMVVGVGQRVQDRLDQQGFRRGMLFVLVIVGFNLIRKGVADMV